VNPLRRYSPEHFLLDLETWLSHVNYDRRYALMRLQAAERVRNA
jgi:hypothetical protein